MELAKQHIDVGLFTNNREAMLSFWRDDVGLPFEELLAVGGGVRQHRHAMNGSVLKLNDARDPLPPEPASGYRELLIAREGLGVPKQLTDPDGNQVTLVPPGLEGVVGIGVRLGVQDVAAVCDFYGRTLKLEEVSERTFQWGDSLVFIEHDLSAVGTGEMRAKGFRYLTVQVWDVDSEHRGFIERGAQEGRPPITLGTTARVSFIRDPAGNWIEVSQRASLTGPVPSRE